MTTFIRTYFPFSVQASVDSATPDFRVSTDGSIEIANLTLTSLTFEPVATSVVTSTIAPRHILFRDAAGDDWYIPVFASTST